MIFKHDRKNFDRRTFLKSTVAAGTAAYFSSVAAAAPGDSDDLNIALIGAGAQGQVLTDACMKIPGLRFKAVCDIWEKYNLRKVQRRLKAYKHDCNAYIDYKEMLANEKDLDAVIIATPDFWHSPQTVDCLNAGLHVYCEKEMSNTLDGAKKMVEAAKQTGKLLQIGHQRRSNPRYIHSYDKLIKEAEICGRITTVNGQWNRSARPMDTGSQKYQIETETLKKFGFDSMLQFRNWRWFKGLGGGPIVDLGSHQIDIYNWFLQTQPKSVIASGGTDYYDKSTHQWYDTVMAIYTYETKKGPVRAFYQTITTNSGQGYFEMFMGDEGTLVISEASSRGSVYREPGVEANAWDKWVKAGILQMPEEPEPAAADPNAAAVTDVRETPKPPEYKIPVEFTDPYHKPHLENFFNAVRGKEKLNCPPQIGYETAVTVLKVNEAVEAERKLDFTPQEFTI